MIANLIIADDHTLMRHGLVKILGDHKNLCVVGGVFYCHLTRPVMRRYEQKLQASGKKMNILTTTELDIIKLTCDGLNTKEVAAQPGLTKNTVDSHSLNIKQKTGIKSIAGMVSICYQKFYLFIEAEEIKEVIV